MKKQLFVLPVLALLTIASAEAQFGTSTTSTDTGSGSSEKAIPRINATGGFSASKVAVEGTDSNVESKMEGAYSLTADIGSSNFVLETGANYRSLGRKINDQANVNLNYIGVPVLAKMYLGNPSGTSLFIRAGVQPSWAVSKNVEATVLGTQFDADFDAGIKDFDLPAVAGVGVKLGLAPTVGLLLSADYSYSILPIQTSGETDIRNEAFAFQGGLAIEL